MTAPDQPFQDFEFTLSNRGIHTIVMLISGYVRFLFCF